jgi:uncharacterized repeat protein (TIGR01451 family)
VFHGRLSGPGINGSNNAGFWKSTPDGPQVVLRVGDQVPGYGTVTNIGSGGGTFGWNDAAQLAFPVTFDPGPSVASFTDVVRIDTASGAITSLARTDVADDPLGPSADGIGPGHHFDGYVGDTGTGTVMNAHGEVTFQATYAGPAGSGNRGIVLHSGGVNRIVASTDFDNELGPGLGAGVEFFSFDTIHMNACGQVAIAATINTATVDGDGLWAWTGSMLRKIVFEGELFDVDPGAAEDLRAIRDVLVLQRGSGGNDSRPRILNDAGTLTFLLIFEDQTRGIFTAQLPLEGAAERCLPNLPPTAAAGPNRAIRQHSEVMLDGQGSDDPDDGPQPLTYAWTQTAGHPVALSDPAVATPRAVLAQPGSYTFELVVSDGQDDSAPDEVTYVVPALGDIDLDADVDSDDLAVVEAALGTPATGPNDLSDLNGDGAIDNLDADILRGLCTRPHCATSDDAADLAVTISANVMAPNFGDFVTFLVTVTNLGPSPASNVQIAQSVGSGISHFGGSASQGAYDTDTRTWSVGALASGASATLEVLGRVQIGAHDATSTIVTSAPLDPHVANNTATLTLQPLLQADVGVSIAVDPLTPTVGDTVIWMVRAYNDGPAAASAVDVLVDLQSGLLPVSFEPQQGTYDAASGTWSVGAIASGEDAFMRVTLQLATDDDEYTASFTITDVGAQSDPNAANDVRVVTVTPIGLADLGVAVVASDATPPAGGHVAFTVTVTNHGPTAATGVEFENHPSVFNPLSIEGNSHYTRIAATASEGAYQDRVWAIGTLAAGATATLTLEYAVGSGAGVAVQRFQRGASTSVDPNAANDVASVTVTPVAPADIALSIGVNQYRNAYFAPVGSTFAAVLTATNHGPGTATGVEIARHVLFTPNIGAETGYTLLGTTASHGGFANDIWTIPSLAAGASATLVFEYRVEVGAVHALLSAGLSSSESPDPNSANNGDLIAVIPILQADVGVQIAVDNPTPAAGEHVVFTVAVTNHGPSPSNIITFATASLPLPGYTLQGTSLTRGTFFGGDWTIGTIAAGETVTLQLDYLVTPSAGSVTVSFQRSYGEVPDPNPNNNTSSVTVQPVGADIGVSVTVSDPAPDLGETITFTVTVTNHGPATAQAVTVVESAAAGYLNVNASWSASQGTFAGNTWTIGSLAPGSTATLTRHWRVSIPPLFTIAPDPYTKTFTASVVPTDPEPANNTASVTPVPRLADVALTLTADDMTPQIGQVVTFTLTLRNDGPAQATGIVIQELLGGGYSNASPAFAASAGSYSLSQRRWTVPSLPAGATATLTRRLIVGPSGNYSKLFLTTGLGLIDPNPFNNAVLVTPDPE